MKNKKQVSVLVLLFNPDFKKVLYTLTAIIGQKNVEFDIIISDDGSECDYFDEIKTYFQEKNFQDYRFTKCLNNVGTVKNYINALRQADGEFIFATSPGDILYDDAVLCDFYQFAMRNSADLCFGNAVYYNYADKETNIIFGKPNYPPWPDVFDGSKTLFMEKSALFFGCIILGATFFRERRSAIHYLEQLDGLVKYAEDNTSAFLALADGKQIRSFDRQMVWYEYGSGISTNGQSEWTNLLVKDYDAIYRKLKELYPNDPVIDAAYYDRFSNSKLKSKLYRIIRHPILCLCLLRMKHMRKKEIGCTINDKNKLEHLLCEVNEMKINASNKVSIK